MNNPHCQGGHQEPCGSPGWGCSSSIPVNPLCRRESPPSRRPPCGSPGRSCWRPMNGEWPRSGPGPGGWSGRERVGDGSGLGAMGGTCGISNPPRVGLGGPAEPPAPHCPSGLCQRLATLGTGTPLGPQPAQGEPEPSQGPRDRGGPVQTAQHR